MPSSTMTRFRFRRYLPSCRRSKSPPTTRSRFLNLASTSTSSATSSLRREESRHSRRNWPRRKSSTTPTPRPCSSSSRSSGRASRASRPHCRRIAPRESCRRPRRLPRLHRRGSNSEPNFKDSSWGDREAAPSRFRIRTRPSPAARGGPPRSAVPRRGAAGVRGSHHGDAAVHERAGLRVFQTKVNSHSTSLYYIVCLKFPSLSHSGWQKILLK